MKQIIVALIIFCLILGYFAIRRYPKEPKKYWFAPGEYLIHEGDTLGYFTWIQPRINEGDTTWEKAYIAIRRHGAQAHLDSNKHFYITLSDTSLVPEY